MADLTKLHEAIAALSAKVDALTNKPAPEPTPVVDDQSPVDAITAEVEAITAKLPA